MDISQLPPQPPLLLRAQTTPLAPPLHLPQHVYAGLTPSLPELLSSEEPSASQVVFESRNEAFLWNQIDREQYMQWLLGFPRLTKVTQERSGTKSLDVIKRQDVPNNEFCPDKLIWAAFVAQHKTAMQVLPQRIVV